MECKDIREKLSAYVEGVVFSEEQAAIEIHLKSCPRCSEALSDLSKTIEHLKTLEEVTPPAWLTQKIMTKVRAEAEPGKGVFQRLFYPLHIKLPVGAIATIAIALTTIYIFRTIQPEIKVAKAPTEEVAPQVFQKEQQSAPGEAEDKGVIPPVLPSGKVRSEEGLSLKGDKGGLAGKAAPAPERLAEEPAPLKEPESMRDRFEATPKAPEPMKQAEPTRAAEAPAQAKKHERVPAAGALAKDEARQETGVAGPKAKLSLMEKKKEEPLVLTIVVKDPEIAVREVEKIVKELEGKVSSEESVEEKRIITAEINAAKLKNLIEKLKAVGQVTEKEVDIEALGTKVAIRIEIARIAK